MKCENCPYYVKEGVNTDFNWCKLYNGQAPIEGCEKERDAYLRDRELIQNFPED